MLSPTPKTFLSNMLTFNCSPTASTIHLTLASNSRRSIAHWALAFERWFAREQRASPCCKAFFDWRTRETRGGCENMSVRHCATMSISTLPLPSRSLLLTHNLTPDPQTPSPTQFFNNVLKINPSIQRRARLLSPNSHFSYVSPFPLPFPYQISTPEPIQDDYVEKWLSDREAIHLKDDNVLKKYYPFNRDQPRVLIGLAETGIKDCVPNLDVGDAFKLLGKPALAPDDSPPPPLPPNPARDDLIDVLSGHAVLMSDELAPWSLRYSGHQFGAWAGQLGDGRAISIRKSLFLNIQHI